MMAWGKYLFIKVQLTRNERIHNKGENSSMWEEQLFSDSNYLEWKMKLRKNLIQLGSNLTILVWPKILFFKFWGRCLENKVLAMQQQGTGVFGVFCFFSCVLQLLQTGITKAGQESSCEGGSRKICFYFFVRPSFYDLSLKLLKYILSKLPQASHCIEQYSMKSHHHQVAVLVPDEKLCAFVLPWKIVS